MTWLLIVISFAGDGEGPKFQHLRAVDSLEHCMLQGQIMTESLENRGRVEVSYTCRERG